MKRPSRTGSSGRSRVGKSWILVKRRGIRGLLLARGYFFPYGPCSLRARSQAERGGWVVSWGLWGGR